MAPGFRDMSTPYSDVELEEILKVLKTCPSWTDEDGGSISVNDIEIQIKALRYDRSPEQIQQYKDWVNSNTNGRVYWKNSVATLKNIHTIPAFAKAVAQICDKDGNGFISEDEFKGLLTLLAVHDSKFGGLGITFEDFVKNADTNRDGKVSIEECVAWIEGLMR